MRLIAIYFLILFHPIENTLQLISSKKQKILPGIPTQEVYDNFLITLKAKKRTSIVLDSVHVYDQNICWSTTFFLKRKNATFYSNKITLPAEYILQIPLSEMDKQRRVNHNGFSGTKIILFYKKYTKRKEFVINKFIEETISKR